MVPGFLYFIFSLFSFIFIKKNILLYLMALEVMLIGISFLLIIFSIGWEDPSGSILVLLIMSVAASEIVIALASSIAIFRNFKSLSIKKLIFLRG
jgi:NADH-ubiquinone oxidoreductase chain 4L